MKPKPGFSYRRSSAFLGGPIVIFADDESEAPMNADKKITVGFVRG